MVVQVLSNQILYVVSVRYNNLQHSFKFLVKLEASVSVLFIVSQLPFYYRAMVAQWLKSSTAGYY